MVDLALHVIPLKHLHGEVSVFRGVYVLQDLVQSHHAQQRCRISHGLVVVHVVHSNHRHLWGPGILLTLLMEVLQLEHLHVPIKTGTRGGGSISDEKS